MDETPDRAAEAALAPLVHAFPGARVLVLGDVILDRYVIGQAARLSPEAPIPVLRPSATRAVAGGAANVAANIAELGGQAVLIGLTGADAGAADLARLLGARPAIAARLIASPARPTTVKTRFMSGAHQLLRLDEEQTDPPDPESESALAAAFDTALGECQAVVLSDYAKGVLGGGLLRHALDAAASAGKPVIADPKRADFAAYRGASLLTPNEAELRAASARALPDFAALAEAAAGALAAFAGQALLVTRSEKGLAMFRPGAAPLVLAARAREVSDVSGAGDTLVAALAVALAAGADLADAARLANITAGLSVAKQGTSTVSAHELLGALHLEDLLATDRKVMDAPEAAAQAAAWRAQGLRVGFANGCFDLIHPGHVRLLREARAACDRLVVALNTDASVRRLKGASRPVQTETARATVMASLAPVDLVTLFDTDTPLDLIRAVRPDVLVKGSDYREDQVVGGDLVRGWGGRVLLVNLQEGHSTSATIRRMAAG
ncbi:MAG: D-glycero-beta-D-manno-heptose 1-phosphate adenylyltransferase [Rhodospirillales bacterium]|nr:D-glycero-beta-D-manno-heptose 1-phosphate adenylyltransferase [Rhodospirillales bacterium]